MDAAAANALISRFSSDLTATTNRERRVAMSSPLYDLPGRSSLGFAIIGEIGPGLVARLEAAMPAEEIGRRMRDVLVRPYFLQLFILFEGYLMGREQQLIEQGGIGDAAAIERDAAETIAVTDWFVRVCGAYRSDDALFPGAEVLSEPILDPEQVAVWSGGEPLAPELADRAQRAIGQLELYALTVHGEQRDGNFDHGPYAGADGRQLLFHEVNDLDNDFLPWVEAGQRLGVDAVGVLRSFPAGARISCDLFGTSSVAPSGTPFEQLALLVREGERVRALELEELEEIAAAATRATAELYRRIAGWEPEYRTAYGRPLFLNHLLPFLRIAGAPELEEWLVEAGEAAGPRDVAAISGTGATAVWSRLAAGAEMFSPLRQAVAR